jgi:hypothetical protein
MNDGVHLYKNWGRYKEKLLIIKEQVKIKRQKSLNTN